MDLSAELFESTIQCMKGDRATGEAENRACPRVGLRCRFTIAIFSEGKLGKPMTVWTRDISRGGIGIMSSLCIEVGTRFVVRLPRKNSRHPLVLICTAKNCTELAQGIYAIGATFAQVLDKVEGQQPAPEVDRVRSAVLG